MRQRLIGYLMVVGAGVGITAFATVSAALAAWLSTSAPVTATADAATMPAGNMPAVTADAAAVTVSWAASRAAGHPVTGYQVYRDGKAATGGCAGVVTSTGCTEAEVPDGTWRYTVVPVQGAHWLGPESPQGTVRVTTVGITFPVSGRTYGIAGYNAGCATGGGDFCGTGTGVVRVSVRQDGTGNYWNPSDDLFDSPAERTQQVANPADWRMPFPVGRFPAAGRYTLTAVATDRTGRQSTARSTFTVYPQRPPTPSIAGGPPDPTNLTTAAFTVENGQSTVELSCSLDGADFTACPADPVTVGPLANGRHRFAVQATDPAGNTSPVAAYTWTVDTTPPQATNVQATNGTGGTPGRIEAGDTVRLAYSEPVAPGSVLPGWDGSPTTVHLTFDLGTQAVSVDGTALGTVALGRPGYVLTGTTATATLAAAGTDILLTVTGADPAGFGTVTAPGTLTWTPGTVTDPAGNALRNAGMGVAGRPHGVAF